MKKPIALTITDTHLSESTMGVNISIFDQVVEICKENNIKAVFHLGDWFISRSGQSELILNTLAGVLKKINDNGIEVFTIKGNHDCADLKGDQSFLDVYSPYKGFHLYNHYHFIDLANVRFHLMPYFDESMYLDVFKPEFKKGVKNILGTHISVENVLNNKCKEPKKFIPKGAFEGFDEVWIGHYHNQQEFDYPGGKGFYIGSTHQSNFGEDDQKGCRILYNDGTSEFVKLKFPEYKTFSIQVEALNDVVAQEILKDTTAHKKVQVHGSKREAVNKWKMFFEEHGIKFENKLEDLKSDIEMNSRVFTEEDLVDVYDEWATERNIKDADFGKNYIIN